MTPTDRKLGGSLALTATVTPDPADAGGIVEIAASAVCEPACDLTGDLLRILDASGAEIGTLEFTAFDPASGASTGTARLAAPRETGDCAWVGEIAAFDVDDELAFASVSIPIRFAVRAHAPTISVWDVPSAIEAGSRFAVKVGVRCPCGCAMAGQAFSIDDDAGHEVGAGHVGADIWPETEGVFYAEAELEATGPIGRRTWLVRIPPGAGALPHAAAEARLGLVLVPSPEHLVRIEAVDRDTAAPLAGAIVVMHPYRAVADANGVAELRVPTGAYTLFVSARRHVSDRASLDVQADVTARAALAVEIRPERV